ncbi:MAG: S24 family peptidase [Armatimonadota bacterium]
MQKTIYLSDITPGASFKDGLFAIKDVKRMTDRNGKQRATLTLFDSSGTVEAIRWDVSETEYCLLQSACLLTVSGSLKATCDSYPCQIRIDTFTAHTEFPNDVSPYLPPLPGDQEAVVRQFDGLMRSVANPHLSQLLQRVFSGKRRQQFLEAVAAKTLHHAYRGGLLRHTVEVAEICRAVLKVYPSLRHDLLITGALLHDSGKLFEMDQEWRTGEYTAQGLLEGHIVGGAFFIGAQVNRIPGFPLGLAQALRHLVLSHHDRPEWGAAVAPALPEAVVLAKCDQISAQTTLYLEATNKATPGEIGIRRGDHHIVVADLGLSELDLGGFPDDNALEATVADSLRLNDLPRPKQAPQQAGYALLPLRGLVAAGDGERSSEVPVEMGEAIAALLPPGGADYLTQVVGDSMIGAGIHEGDRAYVRHQETAKPGEIVIAFVPGSGLVIKRFDVTTEGSFLFSENPDTRAYPPIPIVEGTRIQGIVTRVERDLVRR